MPVYKDSKTGKWLVETWYKDWSGKRLHKTKRGFATKKEAAEWEKSFLNKAESSLSMKFKDFIDIYMKDMEGRLKITTIENKYFLIEQKILPYFGDRKLDEIKATDIRAWQNEMYSLRDSNGLPYSPTYLKTINNQITAVFNYAVKFYGLRENPCHKAGTMGQKNAEEMLFWTRDEFTQFIKVMNGRLTAYTIFMTLYYTGMREGELLALTPADINLQAGTISINKNYHRLNGRDIITSPKTPKSNRIITIPSFLCDCLQKYMAQTAKLKTSDRLFSCTKSFLYREMEYGCKVSGVKRIRIHDLRHSHASLLIEMGFSPLLIAERLGHERVQTTMDTYSHLYPDKQALVSRKLDEMKIL